MAKDDELERTSEMEITIKIGKDMLSERKFLLYPGTEIVYGQGVDLAVSKALGQISKAAYDILIDAGDAVPEVAAIEAMFGKAVQDAQG